MENWKYPEAVQGWLTPIEARALAELAQNKLVLEIGSFKGKSTIAMAQVARLVHCIDWFRGDFNVGNAFTLPEFLKNLQDWQLLDKVILHVGKTLQITPVMTSKGYFQLAFIDGNHAKQSVLDDLSLAWWVTNHDTGIIALHDYRDKGDEGVREGFHQFFGQDMKPHGRADSLAWVHLKDL